MKRIHFKPTKSTSLLHALPKHGHMPLLCVQATQPQPVLREKELILFLVYVIFCSDIYIYIYIEERSGCARHMLGMEYFIKGT